MVEEIKAVLLSGFSEQEEKVDKKAAVAESEAEKEASPEDKASKESEEVKKKEKTKSLDALLRARKSLIQAVSKQLDKPFDVSLNGVETGEIEAVVKARWEYDQVFCFPCLLRALKIGSTIQLELLVSIVKVQVQSPL